MTEINPPPSVIRRLQPRFRACLPRQAESRKYKPMLTPLNRRRKRRSALRMDYAIRGPIISWRELKNRERRVILFWRQLTREH
jgi:hypothetical protein